jgi:hypothetical protein
MVCENSIASEGIVIQAPEELGVLLSLLRPPLTGRAIASLTGCGFFNRHNPIKIMGYL